MPNFVVLLDRDVERRARFAAATKGKPAFLPGLREGEASADDVCVMWAHGARAPFSKVIDGDGLALLWGDAIPGPGPARLDAAGVRARWLPSVAVGAAPTSMEAFDGYHAAVVYAHSQGLLVGADILGAFPIYYFPFAGGALVGTSPSLFAAHPAFRMALSPRGLAQFLLFNYTFHQGATMVEGVTRLEAGRVLHVDAAGAAREVHQYDLPLSQRYFDHSYKSQLRVLGDALDDAHARHVTPNEPHALFLSGGMDSRMMAGYLRKHQRPPALVITFGAPGDSDLMAAARVAKHLRWPQRVRDVPVDAYDRFGPYCASVEHLAGGFAFMNWGYTDALRDAPGRVVNGYGSDIILRGCNPEWDRHEALGPIDFDYEFNYQVRGFRTPESLKAALRPGPYRDAVDPVMADLRRTYDGWAPLTSHRSWKFGQLGLSRMRLGMNLWRLSFFSWPVQPVSDRRVLEAAGGMPQSTMGERRAQQDLIISRFPDLAALPIARSWYDLSPLAPTLRWRVSNALEARVARRLPFLRTRHARAELFYHRVIDFNGERYRKARAAAEPWRGAAGSYLLPEALDQTLPRPDVPLTVTTNRLSASGIARILVGFLHWLKYHGGAAGEHAGAVREHADRR